MAITAITNVALTRNTLATAPVMAAVGSVTEGDATVYLAKVPYTNKDDGRLLIMIQNTHESAAKDIKIRKGNALQSTDDLVLADLAAGATKYVVVESGKYGNVSGDYKGHIIVEGESTDIKVGAVELP